MLDTNAITCLTKFGISSSNTMLILTWFICHYAMHVGCNCTSIPFNVKREAGLSSANSSVEAELQNVKITWFS